MDEKIKIGSTIYFFDVNYNSVIQGIVRDIYLENSQMTVEIRMESCTDQDGNESPLFGTIYKKMDDISLYSEKAYHHAQQYEDGMEEDVPALCRQIVSLEDLIRFPLRYDIQNNENERIAYQQRAKELIGIAFR